MGLPPKILLGILLAFYPLGILIGSSFIGALSDLFGRKPTLITSLLLAAVGYALTGYAVYLEHYPLFALARLLTGVCEGNLAISRAIALELHPVINRTRAISLLYATNYAGWLVGPLLGGYLMPFGVANVFYLTGLVTLAVTALVQFSITRVAVDTRTSGSLLAAIANNNSIGLLRVAEMRPLIVYHLLFSLGLNAFYEFYPMWLVERFGFDSIRIGWGTVVITLAMIISSVYAVTPME